MSKPEARFDRGKYLTGEWNFIGYFPQNCKDLPPCYTNKMTFKRME